MLLQLILKLGLPEGCRALLLALKILSHAAKLKTLWLLGAFTALVATLGCVPSSPLQPPPPTAVTWKGEAYFWTPRFSRFPGLYFVDPVTNAPRKLSCGCRAVCRWSHLTPPLWDRPQQSEIVALDYGKDFMPRALAIRNIDSGVSIEFAECPA